MSDQAVGITPYLNPRSGTGDAPPTPPHSIEAERECVAAPLVDVATLGPLAALLRPEDFHVERHRLIFTAMLELREAGTPIDPVTLLQRLRDRGSFERVGGPRAIGEILDRAGTVANICHYAEIVRRKAAFRALIEAARRVEVAGHDADEDVEDFVANAVDAFRRTGGRFQSSAALRLTDWTASRYGGTAPAVDWIVPEVLARGEAHVLAAPGDSGKGFITINLALQLASGIGLGGRRAPFGHPIPAGAAPVTCVLLYAEDAEDALHRRIDALDRDGEMRRRAGDRFIAVPLPSTGGAPSILEREGSGTFRTTGRWRDILDQLGHLPDLGLVIVDPLSCFLALDIDADSAVAQAVTSELARAAAELRAAIILAHHMRKTGDESRISRVPELPTHQGVRDSIRGVAALLNGVRMAYGIVPLPSPFARAVLRLLGESGEQDSGRVYWGAVVKANGKTDRRPRLYVRAHYGLLEDRTNDVVGVGGRRLEDVLKELAQRDAA